MDLLLNIGIVIVLACYLLFIGLIFKSKLEFFCRDMEKDENETYKIIVFGKSKLAKDCEAFFNRKCIRCKRIEKLETDLKCNIWKANYILAVDDSDYENLVACTVLRTCCDSDGSYAICNEEQNRKIFQENKIMILEDTILSEKTIYRMIKENCYVL